MLESSLKKIAKGTAIVLLGTILGNIFAFGNKIIIVRYITKSDYGLLSLGLAIFEIILVLVCMGFSEGVTRYISYFQGRKETEKTWGIITSSVKIILLTSLAWISLVYLLLPFLAATFHEPNLSLVLKVFIFAIPFAGLTELLTAVFRGFDKVGVKVLFGNILLNLFRALMFISVVLLGLAFTGIVYSYLISFAVVCVILIVYAFKHLPKSIQKTSSTPMGKKLLLFSLPLLGANILAMVMAWTDTLMLGYFKTTEVVGLYNVALPLARLIPIILASMMFIYTPVVSQLYSKNAIGDIEKTYVSTTKWVFLATTPLLFGLILFPKTAIELSFGMRYVEASIALQLLALGFFVHTILGPNDSTLIAMGKTRFIMLDTLIAASANVALNILLIPLLGLAGAAIASTVSLATANILISIQVYSLSKIHPFTKTYLKPMVTSLILAPVVYFIGKSLLVFSPWMLIPVFLLFFLIYLVAALVTRSFDKEDVMILKAVERRMGVEIIPIKNLLRRFI